MSALRYECVGARIFFVESTSRIDGEVRMAVDIGHKKRGTTEEKHVCGVHVLLVRTRGFLCKTHLTSPPLLQRRSYPATALYLIPETVPYDVAVLAEPLVRCSSTRSRERA